MALTHLFIQQNVVIGGDGRTSESRDQCMDRQGGPLHNMEYGHPDLLSAIWISLLWTQEILRFGY